MLSVQSGERSRVENVRTYGATYKDAITQPSRPEGIGHHQMDLVFVPLHANKSTHLECARAPGKGA